MIGKDHRVWHAGKTTFAIHDRASRGTRRNVEGDRDASERKPAYIRELFLGRKKGAGGGVTSTRAHWLPVKDEVGIDKLSRASITIVYNYERYLSPSAKAQERDRPGTRGALNGVDNRARARERDNDFRPVRGRRRR